MRAIERPARRRTSRCSRFSSFSREARPRRYSISAAELSRRVRKERPNRSAPVSRAISELRGGGAATGRGPDAPCRRPGRRVPSVRPVRPGVTVRGSHCAREGRAVGGPRERDSGRCRDARADDRRATAAIASVTATASVNATAIPYGSRSTWTTTKNAAVPNRPVSRPRRTSVAACGPSRSCVNTASTDTYTGNVAAMPLVTGPSSGAMAVRARTRPVPTTIRTGRSQAGCGALVARGTRRRDDAERTRDRRARRAPRAARTGGPPAGSPRAPPRRRRPRLPRSRAHGPRALAAA